MKFSIIKYAIICCSLLSMLFIGGCAKDSTGFNDNNNNVGKGGSLARFIIVGQYMYVVDNATLKSFSLANPQDPKLENSIQIGFNIETIYAFNDNLFIGSRDAMYIYNLQNPAQPTYKSTSSHVRACDPVVAQDDYAFVTVRSSGNGSPCGGNTNMLMIYDVKNIAQPILINELAMSNPHGLGIKGNTLYVCDGKEGLRIIDVTDKYDVKVINTLKSEYEYQDVIIEDNFMFCMLPNGFVIYDISQPLSLPVKVGQMIN